MIVRSSNQVSRWSFQRAVVDDFDEHRPIAQPQHPPIARMSQRSMRFEGRRCSTRTVASRLNGASVASLIGDPGELIGMGRRDASQDAREAVRQGVSGVGRASAPLQPRIAVLVRRRTERT